MKHDYGNVAQIGNALYLMASLSKSPILAFNISNRAERFLTARFEIKLVFLK